MSDIIVHKVNEATICLEADNTISTELNNYFSVFANNYRWSPKYRNGFWDGKIRFMRYDNTLPIGLLHRVKQFAKLGNYSIKVNFEEKLKIDPEQFKRFANSLNITGSNGQPIILRGYQLQAAYDACKNKHLSIESVTSSGKSVIIYLIIRFLLHIDSKVLLIVPRTQLVHQLRQDFIDYGWKNAQDEMHLIYSGQKKVFDAPVICSTWQSLYRDSELFAEFDALIIDEAHGAKGQSIGSIGQKCINAEHRIGTSGTYPEDGSADWHSIVGTIGPIKRYTTYKKLQKDGYIADLKIFAVKLNYDKEYRSILFKSTNGEYAKENDEIIQNDERTKMITDLVNRTTGNTIVLFTKIQKHGQLLLESFKKNFKDKHIFYVDGSVSMETRENIRASMEQAGQTWKIFEFEKGKVRVLLDTEIPLKNNKKKKAKDITTEDDIDDDWILNNSKK